MAKELNSPITLQERCCQLVVDSTSWSDLPGFQLPSDTYLKVETYVKSKTEWERILRHLYIRLYKDSDVRLFNLSGLKDERFLQILNLEFIVSLNLSNSRLPDESYTRIVMQTRNVQFLDLSYCKRRANDIKEVSWPDGISDETFLAIAKYCPKIVNLDISDTYLDMATYTEAFCPTVDGRRSFSELRVFAHAGGDDDEDIIFNKGLLDNCPHLETLRVNSVMMCLEDIWLNEAEFNRVCANPYRIKNTGISQCRPSYDLEFFRDLRLMCPMITEMALGIDLFDEFFDFKRGEMPQNLQYLKVYVFDDYKTSEITARKDWGRLVLSMLDAGCKNLQVLKLDHLSHIRCLDILRNCPKLKELSVSSHMDSRFANDIDDVTPAFGSLKKFTLHGNWNINQQTTPHDEFVSVIKLFPNLTELDVCGIRFKREDLLLNLFSNASFTRLENCIFRRVLTTVNFVEFILMNMDKFPKLAKLRLSLYPLDRQHLDLELQECLIRKLGEIHIKTIAERKGLQKMLDLDMGFDGI